VTTLAQVFGTSTAFTINSTSWTQATVNSTNAVDVSAISPVPVDIMVTVDFATSGTIAAQKAVNVYVAVSEDGTHYTDNDLYSGTNNSQSSLRSPTNFLVGPPIAVTTGITQYGVIVSLRAICGGILPRKFGLLFENQSNVTLTALAATYTPVNYSNT
jgi:hypothetical protein